MKNRKATLSSLLIILHLSILLIACSDEQHMCAPIDTAPPTQPPATVSNNNIDNTQATVSVKETTAPMVDETTAPMVDKTTVPTENTTMPTELEETTPHEHDYSVVEAVMPSCTEDGHKTYECPCGDTHAETIEARGYHAWGEWKITQEATTSREGERVRYCTDCDTAQYEAIAKLPPEETTTPTEPVVTEPLVTEPPATEPPVTEPPATEPPATEPPATEPPETEPPHEHSYAETVIAPTCTEDGYSIYTCGCGSSYTDAVVPALGHDCSEEFVIVDVADLAYTLYICNRCSYEYGDNYISYTVDATEIQNAIIKYINQYRAQQGSTQLTYLPGMTQVAKYRSVQLTTNFAHNTSDMREAAAYYEYGEWVDPADYGDPNGVGYYRTYSQEANAYGYTGSSADEIGMAFATGILNSPSHWRYIGSSEYSYIGVGCTKYNGKWYCCMMVGSVNFG